MNFKNKNGKTMIKGLKQLCETKARYAHAL